MINLRSKAIYILFLITFLSSAELVNAQVATSSASTSPQVVIENLATSTKSVKTATSTVPSVMLSGKASWYSYKGGMFAASPDFKVGTRLKVWSLANPAKVIEVVVNDYGPVRAIHPDRVIDLDKVAFAALAPLGAGVISVRIEPVKSVTSSSTQFLASSSVAPLVVKKTNQTNNDIILSSESGIVISAKTGKVIWSKNSSQQLPLASLTKIVAMKVFLDTKPRLSKVVKYKKQDEEQTFKWANPGEIAKLKVKDGETMTVNDLLYSALLGSANNAVETLVRVSGLTRKQFISRMNTFAKKNGAKQTYFVEPTGLAPQNVSSAKDYAILSKIALANPSIAKVTSAKSYSFKTINTGKPHLIRNTNKLRTTSNLNITGSKTGYLEEAKYCLMTRAKSKKGEVIAVTMGTENKYASFSETKKLLEYGLSHLN
jgi:D-alanyl-D-alanine carboxypeptidase